MSRPSSHRLNLLVFLCSLLSSSLFLWTQTTSLIWLGASQVNAGQASSPDLIISSISNPPAGIVAGRYAISVTDTTQNIGDGTANPSTTRYYASVDTTITGADTLLPVTRSVPTLKKNFSSTGTVTVSIPANFPPGIYYLGACADNLAVIPESNENNNCKASTTTMQVYPPTSLTVAPTSVTVGGSVTATWTQTLSSSPRDWIGLYVPGSANTAYIAYEYVGCTSTPTVGVPAGSCPFAIPSRLLKKD